MQQMLDVNEVAEECLFLHCLWQRTCDMFLCLLGACLVIHCSLKDAYISWDKGELEKPQRIFGK